MEYTFTPTGVCSQRMDITLEDGVVTELKVTGGCHGNLQGICALVKGRPAAEVIASLEGIDCRGKGTSCPDQLSRALREAMEAEAQAVPAEEGPQE